VRHIPNLICLIRLLLVWPVASALEHARYALALGLFIVAAVSDGLDGFLAKRFNWTSELGKVLDPAADKLLLVVVFVETAWLGLVPWWLTAAAVARDVMIALGALAFRLGIGPLHGHPTVISKINTAAQLLYLIGVMFAAAALLPAAGVLRAAALLVFSTTVLSGLDYLVTFTRRAWTASARSA
jgi:cardiolipin synthase